jgi:hypothetical protein
MAVLLIDTVASPLIDKTVLPHAFRAPPEWARIARRTGPERVKRPALAGSGG